MATIIKELYLYLLAMRMSNILQTLVAEEGIEPTAPGL